MGVRIKFNDAEMRALLLSDQVRPPLRAIAEEVAARAKATAPRDSGAYADSIDVAKAAHEVPSRRGNHLAAAEDVVAHDSKSIIIESRTGNLRRALGG